MLFLSFTSNLARARTRASANINRKKPIDPETLAADKLTGTPDY